MFGFQDIITFQSFTLMVGSIVFLAAYVYLRHKGPKKTLPPGPVSLPLVGTMWAHKLNLQPEDIVELAHRYGPIFRLKFFAGDSVIFLNSYEAIKEAAITKPLEFADRKVGHDFLNQYINPKIGGILPRDFDEKGRKLRSISLSIMRDLGAGRSTMEEVMSLEAEELANIFESSKCEPFDPWHKVTACVTNVILHILLNKRYTYTDTELLELIENADSFVQELPSGIIIDRFPFLRFISPVKHGFQNFVSANNEVVEYMWKYSKPIISSFQPGDDSHFVEAYLDKMYDSKQGKISLDEDEFKYLLRDLLLAGIETTTTSLKWTLLYLVNNPGIQKKLQEALDHNVGRDRPYRLADKVPYLDAVIWEVQRMSSVVPQAIPHASSAVKDAELCGFDIPRKSLLIFNIFAVHHDKATWGDPENFRPERFLNVNGDFVKHSHVIPFSIGKRSCLGELLARQELYLFTANLFQRFTFVSAKEGDKIDSKPDMAFTRVPKPFQIRAIPRKN